jgi:hypothetical protein
MRLICGNFGFFRNKKWLLYKLFVFGNQMKLIWVWCKKYSFETNLRLL